MTENILCLGVESTAHTFGAAIASKDECILADTKSIYVPKPGTGIHPRDAAQHHCKMAAKVISSVFKKSKKRPEELDSIAFSAGPGLGPSLRTGATVARALASLYKKPLIPVHHAIGHIEIACKTTGLRDPLVILTSGGHTALAAFANHYWRIFGETEDITVGNLFDSFAREMGLPSPGGKIVEELAEKSHKLIDLPYTVKGNDVSYSGLLTAALKKTKEGEKLENICFSIQEMAFSMLTEATERCLAHLGKNELLLTGGVASNKRLQEMLISIANDHETTFKVVDKEFSGDCGAQIAWTGILSHNSGVKIEVEKSYVKPRWRLDEVYVPWRE